ncbi:MAG TPA: ABC transporter substrate-binding protein [Stellaceae bacterium]|nr:ABC transporter substrate-binding protein [Stellaceae bacterium]
MRRREFLWLLGCGVAAGWPRWLSAQQASKIYRVAIVSPSTPVSEITETNVVYGAFFGELRRLGYVEGQNLAVDRYSGEGRLEHYREVVSAVIRSNPDAVFAFATELALEFKAQTATIPIVAGTYDPLAVGIVPSLARPGGNITGVDGDAGLQTWTKRLGLLKEAIPTLSRIGMLIVPTLIGRRGAVVLKEASDKIGVALVEVPLDSPFDEKAYRRAIATLVQEGAEAIYVSAQYENWTHQQLIVDLARRQGLPTICGTEGFAEMGGLMGYTPDWPDALRHAADQVDQILKGTKPGDIPVYQGTKFHFAINLKTAKVLGIGIPASLLAQADEVIE